MRGKIIKGIAGFYYVDVVESGLYECKARGVFRKEKMKPLVGDVVEMEVLDEAEKTGNIVAVLPRKNELVRPAVANVDQALVVFAVTEPKPHFNLLDRFLVMMEQKEISVVLCFNKEDIATGAGEGLPGLWIPACVYQRKAESEHRKYKVAFERKNDSDCRAFRRGEVFLD